MEQSVFTTCLGTHMALFCICQVLDYPPNQCGLQMQRLMTCNRSGLVLPCQELITFVIIFITSFFLVDLRSWQEAGGDINREASLVESTPG